MMYVRVPKKIRSDAAVYSFTQGLMRATSEAVSNSPITDPGRRKKREKEDTYAKFLIPNLSLHMALPKPYLLSKGAISPFQTIKGVLKLNAHFNTSESRMKCHPVQHPDVERRFCFHCDLHFRIKRSRDSPLVYQDGILVQT